MKTKENKKVNSAINKITKELKADILFSECTVKKTKVQDQNEISVICPICVTSSKVRCLLGMLLEYPTDLALTFYIDVIETKQKTYVTRIRIYSDDREI